MDEYHLAEQVGEGSFGRVFKGRRRYTSQTVAIKLMQKHGKSEKDMRNLRQVRTRARARPLCARAPSSVRASHPWARARAGAVWRPRSCRRTNAITHSSRHGHACTLSRMRACVHMHAHWHQKCDNEARGAG